MKSARYNSDLTEVIVHSRGAVITRRVELAAGESGELEIVVEGIVGRVQEGTVRVRLDQEKARLVAVRSRVELPELASVEGPTRKRVEELQAQIDDKEVEYRGLQERLSRWRAFHISPRGLKELREQGPHLRAKDALELMAVARKHREKLSVCWVEVRRESEQLRRELEEARVEDRQASEQSRQGDAAPRLVFVVHLAEVDELEAFELSYVVDDARWWPTYTVNLDSEKREVSLDVEAVVAQRSGEDWLGVRLALSTAELNTDARLPQLASRRLGRRQHPAPPSGYRPPPTGLDEIFQSYDAGRAKLLGPPQVGQASERLRQQKREEPAKEVVYEGSPAPPLQSAMDSPAPMEQSADLFTSGAAIPPAPVAPPAPQSAGGAPRMSKKRMASRGSGFGGGALQKSSLDTAAEIEPGDGWLNFERLRLGGPESSYRGKLYRLSDDQSHFGGGKRGLASDAGAGMVDPVASRGSFDYRYEGEGHFRIPADGNGHRVQLQQVGGPCQWTWRCVPRAEAAVYREVRFVNPLDAALLDGPARIFVDGEFRSRSRLNRVDQGGEIQLGLGVEERIQVIRNTRFEEEGAGLLGGKRALDHEVDIQLRSSLGIPVEVEVVDRIPVTDDENVSVKLSSEEPASKAYDQSDRKGATLRGGRLWEVALGAGGEASVRFAYQVRIRARDELVGGNRRE